MALFPLGISKLPVTCSPSGNSLKMYRTPPDRVKRALPGVSGIAGSNYSCTVICSFFQAKDKACVTRSLSPIRRKGALNAVKGVFDYIFRLLPDGEQVTGS